MKKEFKMKTKRNKIRSRILSIVLTFVMVFSLMPLMATTAFAEFDMISFPIHLDSISDTEWQNYLDQFDTNRDGDISEEEADEVTYIWVPSNVKQMSYLTHFPLKNLYIYNNPYITEIDLLSVSFTLETLTIHGMNNLTRLNFGSMIRLTELDLWNIDNLARLDLGSMPRLKELNLPATNISSLDVTGCMALEVLTVVDANLTELDLSKCDDLRRLDLSYNELETIDLSAQDKLETLKVGGNNLRALNVGNLPDLTYLDCGYNELSQIEGIETCDKLWNLWVDGNHLDTVAWANGMQDLWLLSVSGNDLGPLVLTDLPNLSYLYCERCDLYDLDVSALPSLYQFRASDNHLLDIKFGAPRPYFDIGREVAEAMPRNQQRIIPVSPDPDHPGMYISDDSYPLEEGHILTEVAPYDYDNDREGEVYYSYDDQTGRFLVEPEGIFGTESRDEEDWYYDLPMFETELPVTVSTTICVSGNLLFTTDDIIPGDDPVLDYITITEPDKVLYTEGEALDLTGLQVSAVYDDESVKPVTGYTTSPANGTLLTPSDTEVTVTFTENGVTKSTSFGITVDPAQVPQKQPVSIQVTANPTKTTYNTGDKLNLSGLKVTLRYDDGSSELLDSSAYTTDPAGNAVLSKSGTTIVKVTYTAEGKQLTTSFNITVNSIIQQVVAAVVKIVTGIISIFSKLFK
jgi:Leucine-rich repeat (LRR) protein